MLFQLLLDSMLMIQILVHGPKIFFFSLFLFVVPVSGEFSCGGYFPFPLIGERSNHQTERGEASRITPVSSPAGGQNGKRRSEETVAAQRLMSARRNSFFKLGLSGARGEGERLRLLHVVRMIWGLDLSSLTRVLFGGREERRREGEGDKKARRLFFGCLGFSTASRRNLHTLTAFLFSCSPP